MKRVRHIALAVLFLASTALGSWARIVVEGDTNGDQAVDVLDLQHVIAEVLGQDAAQAHGDVNHDGVVNVLDFQALLSEAQHATSGDKTPTQQTERNAPVQTRSIDEMALRVSYVKPVAPEEGKSCSSFAARPALYTQVASTKVERQLQNLSPNAPPVIG